MFRVRAFRKDETGTTAVLFSSVLMVLCVAAGMAFDFARAEHLMSELQAAANSATRLEGVTYLANGRLELNSVGTSSADVTYTAVVVNKLVLNSLGAFHIGANYVGDTPLPKLLAGLAGAKAARLLH